MFKAILQKFHKQNKHANSNQKYEFVSKSNLNFLQPPHIYQDSGHNTNPTSLYKQNVIVHRCVNLISQSAGHVPWILKRYNSNKITELIDKNHGLYKLLHRPNPEMAGAEFFSQLIANKLIYGNAYILSLQGEVRAEAFATNLPLALYLLNPSEMEILVDHTNNMQIGYKYKGRIPYSGVSSSDNYYRHNNDQASYMTRSRLPRRNYRSAVNNGDNARSTIYNIDPVSRMSNVLHIKNYNPDNSYYGSSALDAALMQIKLHIEASRWNHALLKNGARPSGALVVKDSPAYLTDEQFTRLKEQLYEKYSGAIGAGRPLLLEGGLSWQEMSISPKDMDFIESKNSAAREIALSFGVPPQLLGISGDNTYSNMQEARLALWEETLIPMLDELADSLSNWLSCMCNQEVIIDFDRDAISALTEKRENLWYKIDSANFMTINEKRAFVGLPPIEGCDRL